MDFSRQSELFNPTKFEDIPVHIIGCGATGSWVGIQLAKLGVKEFYLYDDDIIEEHNIPNQFFPKDSVGKFKADVLGDLIRKFGSNSPEVEITKAKVTGNEAPKMFGIVFCLVDTMKARKEIFANGIKLNMGVKLYVETRMGLTIGRIYALSPVSISQIKAYEGTLYSDEESEVSACGTSQSVAPTANLIASMAVWKLIKFHNNFEINNEVLIDLQNLNTICSTF